MRCDKNKLVVILSFFVLLTLGVETFSASIELPGVSITAEDLDSANPETVSSAMQVLALLTVLSLAPALLIVMTAFTRIVIVLSMLRHAMGLQSTPPNTVLISLALFMTLFTMMPVINKVNTEAFQPYIQKELTLSDAASLAMTPLKEFMVSQTREQDLALMIDLADQELPETIDDLSYTALIPAFMLSELQTAFQIGFVIFLPFLLIDILVASVLMSMGMIMLPPLSISLPIKILMFVLIDGWALLTQSLIGSFL